MWTLARGGLVAGVVVFFVVGEIFVVAIESKYQEE